jgi:hypothetical protein
MEESMVQTPERHAVGLHAGLLQANNIVGSNNIVECNTLTMNSVIALMTSHNIVGSKNIIEYNIRSNLGHCTVPPATDLGHHLPHGLRYCGTIYSDNR